MDSLLLDFNKKRSEIDTIGTQTPKLIPQIKETFVQNEENPFYLPHINRVYDKQFFKLYQYRLNVLRSRVLQNANLKWGAQFKHVKKVLDIEYGSKCWAIGSIYCEMKYKPDILEDVSNDVYGSPDLITKYSDETNDEIMFEDESGRVLLKGLKKKFVTGTVLGLLGEEDDDGNFQVEEVCFPEDLPINEVLDMFNTATTTTTTTNNDDTSGVNGEQENGGDAGNIAFVSGLNINSNNIESLQKLQDYLIGGLHDHNISKLYILGNSISSSDNLTNLNNFLNNIVKSVQVEILPGFNDPSDKSLPQQSLNRKIFNDNSYIGLTTNPTIKKLSNNAELLLTSGENLNDIFKYNFIETTRQEMMELTLRCQNIAPTAPDTLFCYPYDDKDPFILSKWPNFYIVGNQPDFFQFTVDDIKYKNSPFTFKNKNKVHCIGVPEFCRAKKAENESESEKSHDLVVLNPYTLFTELVSLS